VLAREGEKLAETRKLGFPSNWVLDRKTGEKELQKKRSGLPRLTTTNERSKKAEAEGKFGTTLTGEIARGEEEAAVEKRKRQKKKPPLGRSLMKKGKGKFGSKQRPGGGEKDG